MRACPHIYNLTASIANLAQTITSNESGDRFGASIGVGKIDADAKEDLIVGTPGETLGNGPREGRLLLYLGTTSTTLGTYSGVGDQNDLLAVENDTAIPLETRGDESLGEVVVAGAFWGANQRHGFAAAAPGDIAANGNAAGAVFVFTESMDASRMLDQVTMRHGAVHPIR